MKAIVFSTLILALCSTSAFAADKVKVPATAKLLSKSEIVALYDGKLYSWAHPNTDNGNGTTTFVSTSSTISETYNVGGNKGNWEGKITWKDNQYCFQTRGKGGKKFDPKQCNLIYLDGKTAYEVNPKTKKVMSVNNPL